MEYNPYAAPTVEDRHLAAGVAGAGPRQPWEVGEVLGLGWEAVKRDWPVLVFAPFLALLIGNVPSIAFEVVVRMAAIPEYSAEYWMLYAPFTVVNMATSSFFMVGLLRIFCAAGRGAEPDFGVLFSGADRFVAMFLTSLLLFLITWVGFLFLIVPGVVLACGLWLSTYYAAEGRGPIASLQASWEATRGQKGQMFLLGLASFGVLLLGALACCVGMFVALPVTYVATAIVYLRRSGQAAAAVPQGPAGFGP